MNGMILFLEILGTIAFSLSGAIEAMKKKMDILGVMVLGVVTAVGGGILRDIIIGELPPAVFQNARNIIIAIAIAFTAFIIAFFVPKDRQNKYTNIVTVQSQPRKLSFSRCGVSAKYIFTVKCSRMQAFITFNRKNMLGSEQLPNIYNRVLFISDSVGLGAFTILGIRCVNEQYGYNNPALLLFVGVMTGVGGGMIRDILAGNVPYIFRKHVYATASIAGAAAYLFLQKIFDLELSTALSLLLVLLLRILAARFEWNLPKVNWEE